MIASLLKEYGIHLDDSRVEPLTIGLINTTWKVTTGKQQQFILQRINDSVFKKPHWLAENMRMLAQYLEHHSPLYLFVSPIKTNRGEEMVHEKKTGYFRLFPFVQGSHTINVVSTAEQAWEAAGQFGKFTTLLAGFDVKKLYLTLPDFHNLSFRYRQFEDALKNGNEDRIKQSAELILQIKKRTHLLATYENIKLNGLVRSRVTHHDSKISNVLFDERGKGLCVIDLDTVMPGYFISDLGDMMRTYLSPASEEESDFSKITVRDDVFRAIVQGYLGSLGGELSPEEKAFILYAGFFLIYMQAIRFLTDYCNNDRYYGATYEEQNFVRAGNQLCLLRSLKKRKENLWS